jgi:DNA invertase Pin-like site-specific DNA recombinase
MIRSILPSAREGAMTRTKGKRRPHRAAAAKRVALYLRVSTADQTTANQRRELQAVAKRHGWAVVRVFEDAGISGAKGRDERPALDALLNAVARREVDMVAAWSVDRLGRSLTDLLDLLRELHAKGVDLFLHQQGLDTSTPGGRAMFQMMGVFAEFERAMIRERVMSGLARAKAQGTSLGRRRLEASDAPKAKAIRAALAEKKGIRSIARELQTGVGTVLRIKAGLAERMRAGGRRASEPTDDLSHQG